MKNILFFPIALSFLVGFSSLSSEVLWVRVFSYSLKTLPQAFSYVLIIFLLGIAAGAMIGKHYCASKKYDLYRVSAITLLLAGAIDIASIHLINFDKNYFNFALMTFLIFSTALLKSVVFPIAHHLGSNESKAVSRSVSYVYFGNILGSTLGPLTISFVVLAHVSTHHAFYFVGIICFVAAALSIANSLNKQSIYKYVFIIIFSTVGIAVAIPQDDLWVKLFSFGYPHQNDPTLRFKDTVESQHGVINIMESEGGDTVYGFGIYDGHINTDLGVNSNFINRAYKIAGLHEKPEEFLIIGLSSGSWASVVTTIPDVKNIDIVEIDPGYIEIVKKQPEVSHVLTDKRVSIHTDDGRRWLNRNPNRKFDFILMNTSYHYKNNASHLLSKEYFSLVKDHLKENGVFYFNTTWSGDAFNTAAKVFKYAYRYFNFVVVSDSDINMTEEQTMERLLAMKNSHGSVFTESNKADIQRVFDVQMISFEQYESDYHRELEVISDDNPINEYKYGYLLRRLDGLFGSTNQSITENPN